MNAETLSEFLNFPISISGKQPGAPRMTDQTLVEISMLDQSFLSDRINHVAGCNNDHIAVMTNHLSFVKTDERVYGQLNCHDKLQAMKIDEKPFANIALRIRWHRQLEGLTQKDYGDKINQKRANINNWESGDYRLSLDGALALRKTYGLSLDFMYEGIDDALPMTLRAAWRDRPLVSNSK